jgi:hypothetical protein
MSRLKEGFIELAHRVDRRVGWHRLPQPLALPILAAMRERLREKNLHDTGRPPELVLNESEAEQARHLTSRFLVGTHTDVEDPLMGTVGTRFGRNVPLEHTFPETEPLLSTPNVRDVSRELMTRNELIPATTLNVLAAAWIQFEVHDWFSHGPNDLEEPYEIELAESDDWHERPMVIRRTPRDPSTPPGEAQTWITQDTHWWDSSQVYGRDAEFADRARTHEDGKLRVDENGLPPADLEDGADMSDVAGTNWIGLSTLHTLFTLEHNAICDRLKAEHPTWSDDRLYDKARMVNGALIAKIHTLDWTPAIIAHPTTQHVMRIQWWGVASEWMKKRLGRISKSEAISGIPGSPLDYHGVPYSLTEEFVAVYRMHPLLPDEFTFRSLDDEVISELTFPELNALHAHERLAEITAPNALYSLGISHPGAIVLHNFPRFLQRFERPDGFIMDMAATDILRSRERGVPRYTKFRELLYMKPIRTFEELTDNPEWAEELRRVYNDDIDQVDLMSGLYAEPMPKGFGFSDTAFRIFILMASRRLKSDRFFTTDYTPRVYTQAGLDWIEDNDFRSVLLRHFPQLEPALKDVRNPFAPWTRMPAARRAPKEAAVASN